MRSGSLGFEQVISCFLWGGQCCSLVLRWKNVGRKKHRDNEITGRKQALLQNNISKFQKLLILRSRAREEEKSTQKPRKLKALFQASKFDFTISDILKKNFFFSFSPVCRIPNGCFWRSSASHSIQIAESGKMCTHQKEAFSEERETRKGLLKEEPGDRAGTAARQSPWWGWAHSPAPSASQRPS